VRRLLVVSEKSCVPEGEQADIENNVIIDGDNMDALKALPPRCATN
jgi:hypothetical protein